MLFTSLFCCIFQERAKCKLKMKKAGETSNSTRTQNLSPDAKPFQTQNPKALEEFKNSVQKLGVSLSVYNPSQPINYQPTYYNQVQPNKPSPYNHPHIVPIPPYRVQVVPHPPPTIPPGVTFMTPQYVVSHKNCCRDCCVAKGNSVLQA